MKGKTKKIVTFFIVISLIISMVIIKNIATLRISKNIQNIEKQPQAAMTPVDEPIDNFLARFNSYDALIGTSDSSEWGFWDSQRKFNNIYCVQTGKSANNACGYQVYDAYDIDDATIEKYFGDAEHYHHFLYALENMYLIGRSGNEKEYMKEETNEKIRAYTNEDYSGYYNNMIGEINDLDMAGKYNSSTWDAITDNGTIKFMLWKFNGKKSVRSMNEYTDSINMVDNYLGIAQRYLLTSYVKQKDSNGYASNPAKNDTEWNYYKYITGNDYIRQGKVPENSQKYADGLLDMLEYTFDNSTYDMNKYKDFNPNNTYVNKDNAVYDETNNRIGPFTVVNPKGYDISVSYVKYGQDDRAYTVVDENGNDVNLSAKTDGTVFYLKLNESFDSSNALSTKFYIDFGDVPTARLLVPNKDNGQLMTMVDRKHEEKDVSWAMQIDVKPDIALKKYIYAVNGSTANVPSRIDNIDLSPLANETSTNANYYMNKTPLKVNMGDTVTYAIRLFNEGKVNATAQSIIDYLPANLTFVRAYTDFDMANAPGYDGSNDLQNYGNENTIRINNPNTNYITPYSNDDTKDTFIAKSQVIYIDCKVGASKNNYIYTNMAEISEYRIERGSDIDSEASNWQKPSEDRASSEWQNYSNNHSSEEPTWFDNGFHNWGAQDSNGNGDDDDFDKIIIDHIDLALTKRIESKVVGDTREMLIPEDSTTDKSRIEISGYDEVKNGNNPDLLYNMNKKAAHVEREDQLVTVITVYNEGRIDATVKEITDYVPLGLNFNQEKTIEENGDNNLQFTYNNETRRLTINLYGNEGKSLRNLTDYDDDPNNHKVDKYDVKVVFDVSKSASGKIYNSAAITNYGYVGEDGQYYEALFEGVDKDSWAAQDGNELMSHHQQRHNTAESNSELNLTQYNKNELQLQDDDDMDVVVVDYNPNFDLSLRKYIYSVEKQFNSNELVDEQNENGGYKKYSTVYRNRIPVINEESVRELNNGTAAYYHEKLKVITEVGDLVTYRLRVYNEGKGRDYYGRATEITDYLPSGLEFVSLEEGNDSGWSASLAEGNKIVLTYSAESGEEKILPTDSIETLANINKAKEIRNRINNGEEVSQEDRDLCNEYESKTENDYYQEVGVICRVTANEEFKAITNRAAITNRQAYEKQYSTDETSFALVLKENVEDRDNPKPDQLENLGLDTWYRRMVPNETTPEEYIPGEQDDDDFETIYVYNYKVKLVKTDGTDKLPGVDFRVFKSSSISNPEQELPTTELTELETAVKENGEGEYTANAPTVSLENDVYIIKEVNAVNGYYNPFEGKYIRFSIKGGKDRIDANYDIVNMLPISVRIYEDNGDDDYSNDTYIPYDYRDPNSVYNFVTFDIKENEVTVTIINKQLKTEGKYTVKLYKYGTDNEQIAGVQFDASGKINGGNAVAIPSTGTKLESPAEGSVNVIPDSYTSGYIDIDPSTYETQDEITITETGIRDNAVDSHGNLINKKYYTGLLNKEIKIKVNKTVNQSAEKSLYYVDSLDVTIDGEPVVGAYILDNGSKITVNKIPMGISELGPTETVIDIRIWNPVINPTGNYNVYLSKTGVDTPNTLVEGIQFEAKGYFNGDTTGADIPSTGNYVVTEDSAVQLIPSSLASAGAISIDSDHYGTPDYIVLKEKGYANTDAGNVAKNKYHLALKDKEIKVTINKDVNTDDPTNPVYYVASIGLTVDNSSANITGSGYEWTYTDSSTGAQVKVTYNTTTKRIDVKVVNPLKEGSFDLRLVKYKDYDEDSDGKNDPLAGAKFNITVNDGTKDIVNEVGLVSGTDGTLSSEKLRGIKITAEDLTYTVTVTETEAPEGYIGIGNPVTFTATTTCVGGDYKLVTQAKTELNNYVDVTVNEGEILIEAENRVEPVIHKGVKTVENQDSGYDKNEIQTWVINTTVPEGIGDYTEYTVTDTIDPEKTNNNEKRIAFVNEEHPENNVVVKYKGTETLLQRGTHYKVDFDTNTKELKVTFIHVSEDDSNFVGGRNITTGTTLEITYNTQFKLDTNGNPVGLNQSIPNQAHLTYNGNGVGENKTKDSERPEVHTGGLGVFKYDKKTNNALSGAKFRLTKDKTEAENAIAAILAGNQTAIDSINWVKKYNSDGTVGDVWEVTTDSNGFAYFTGLEFGEDAQKAGATPVNDGVDGAQVYKYNWETAKTKYFLVETYVPEDYVLLDQIAAEDEVKKDSFIISDLTTYHNVGNDSVVPEGEYSVEVVKYGRYEEEGQEKEIHPIAGVVFSAKRSVNGLAEEDLGTLTATDSTGKTLVGDVVEIERSAISTDDIYKIKEESVPENSEYYLGFDKEITLKISKQSVKSDDGRSWINSVTGIEMVIEGENITTVTSGKKYTATVTKDGQELEIIAELVESNGGQTVRLTVENPHKAGTFHLNIIKKIKGTNPVQYLPGAGFKVSIKENGEALVDGNGNSLDGTHEYFVNGNGKLVIEDINITKPGATYAVEIEESTVPQGYIGIGEKITFNATSKVCGDKLGLDTKTETISNDVDYEVKENEIWVDVQNKPKPDIHKGVRRIRNQDAGYNGNEIHTWVVNSSIPAGIEDYTKYIITDEIDYEKTNVAEKRIEFMGLDSIEVRVINENEETVRSLVAGTDYEASFNDETKVITIKFIDVDADDNGFKAGRSLPAGNVIEVKYKTKFRLDENGLIIGIQQTIENKAILTFGVKDVVETTESETPEVHTGAVGVFKYEDVNKNGQYDEGEPALEGAHFKIARTREEANRAVSAVLAGNTQELNAINFVKVRDARGNETNNDVELITAADGKAVYQGLEFGGNADEKGTNPTPEGKGGSPVYKYNPENASTTYYLVEVQSPEEYRILNHAEEFTVSMNSFDMIDLNKYYKVANYPKIYDLSLRKFITHVNGEDFDREITDRVPKVTLTDEFKDETNDDVTTAIYEHTKEPAVVQQGNIVTYTLRVYNEGPEDAYASIVKDDIPEGVEFVQYTEGDGSVNETYRWKLVDENDNEVTDVSKAKYIVTDYLSKENGKITNDGSNQNLIKRFDGKTMNELDYKDIKVQFKVTEPNTSERILINYAQISEETNSDGNVVKDRDSTPNKWIDGEDDQDIEKIKLLYFDLALRKWVTKAIVIQDGKETVYETGHKAEDDPEDVVKVDLKKSKLNSVVIKFEYKIRITNEGKIGGWCDEITDHIPDGLRFEQADNPIWTVVDDKTIITDALRDTYLNHGETAEVPVVLTWINSGTNLGIKVNVAEISKDRNEYHAHDVDSTPGNYVWGEDDIDDAPVMLAIKTGNASIGYAILGLVVVSIIAVGVKVIKRI